MWERAVPSGLHNVQRVFGLPTMLADHDKADLGSVFRRAPLGDQTLKHNETFVVIQAKWRFTSVTADTQRTIYDVR
jgi:hypothetical protein